VEIGHCHEAKTLLLVYREARSLVYNIIITGAFQVFDFVDELLNKSPRIVQGVSTIRECLGGGNAVLSPVFLKIVLIKGCELWVKAWN
jgi:hypothetical protein